MQAGEVVWQQIDGGLVGGRSESGQYPTDVGFRVDADQPACAHNTVDHRRTPAGTRVPDEQIVPQTHLCWAEATLDRVLVDADVAAVDLGIAGEIRPTICSVGDRLAQLPEQRRLLPPVSP